MPSGHLVPSGHCRKAGVAVEAVKVGSPNWLAQPCLMARLARPTSFDGSPNEYWLAQQPLSTGSPNGLLVRARPTSFDGGSTPSAPPAAPGLSLPSPR